MINPTIEQQRYYAVAKERVPEIFAKFEKAADFKWLTATGKTHTTVLLQAPSLYEEKTTGNFNPIVVECGLATIVVPN